MQAAEKMARRGVEVSASVPDFGKPVSHVEKLRVASCQVFHRSKPTLLFRLANKVFRSANDAGRHVRSIARDADLIVISQGLNTDGLPWMEAARSSGKRYAVIAQAAAEQWWPVDEAAERLAVCYEAAVAAFFVSQANLDLSRRQFGASLSRGRVVRNPFNVRYEARPAWPEGLSDGLSLACVGRLDVMAKGQDVLLQVMGLPHWRSRNIRLLFVGTGVNGRGLRLMAKIMNLENVTFSGFATNMEEIWRGQHALVLPSRYEGLPLTLVEAMLCGRACIVTDVGGSRELVRDGINGFLAKAPTVELLDEAMNRAWENRGKLREMGERAASDVREWVSADPAEDFVRELETLVE